MQITAVNFAEEVQDFIATNSSLGLIVPAAGVAGNFLIGDILNVNDLDTLLGKQIVLTMFEEGGTITRTGRRHLQERTLRFVYKGNSGQAAVNLCWNLYTYLEKKLTFQTATFRIWLARTEKLPGVFAADQGGVSLADLILTFLVQSRTG